ncbi:MAG: SulP family inorganic anion transporter [Lachnospiraceae bacterium]|nr:SulP family inorganic anion transporter [Lachnospiraceae bacterium]
MKNDKIMFMRLIKEIRTKKKFNIKNDIIAGIVVALVSIPISMGYAQIAGLPVIYGLYGSIFPILVFAFLTTSPQFVVGVDAMPAAMVGSLLAQLGIAAESKEALELVPLTALLVAVWFVVFYLVKAGRIVKYISTPVMGGFISGVGATIILMQVPKLLGGTAGTGEIIILLANIWRQRASYNYMSAVLGIGTIIIILVCKKIIPKVPMAVIMMGVGAVLQVVFRLDNYGVKLLPEVVGKIPEIVIPNLKPIIYNPTEILIQTLSISGVIMAQTLLASGNYAMKYQDEIDNNSELLAYAGMNVAGAAVGCCPINGSVSRSGIADSFGCRSQIMSVAASVTMILVVMFGTPIFKYLPVPVLTGIVMTALIGILEFKLERRLWKTSKNEWIVFILSFGAVLLFGTVYGVMIGCLLSFAEVAISAVRPSTAFVGRIPDQGNFYPIDRNSKARPIKNTVVYRFNGSLFFANIDRFQNDIESSIKKDTRQIVVDARGIDSVDITAVDRLVALNKKLRGRGIKFYITEHEGTLNDQIRILGGESLIEEGVARRTITLALRDAGVNKPYELEEGNKEEVKSSIIEDDDRLAEFEWAFGKDAHQHLELFAEHAADTIVSEIKSQGEHIELLEDKRVHTEWGTIGLFDENEFWDYLEVILEKNADLGLISREDVKMLEQKIENRRNEGEMRLKQLNPRAMKMLTEHRKNVRRMLKEKSPHEFHNVQRLNREVKRNIRNQ